MLFLVQYDRTRGELVSLQSFADDQRREVQDKRLEMELSLHRARVEHEVVILEAVNQTELRRTHRRYFENLEGLSEAHSTDS